jgi:hypothetical protein
MIVVHKLSQRQACKAVSLLQSTVRYKHKPRNDDAVIQELQHLIEKHPAIGFWQCSIASAEKDSYGIISAYTGCIQHLN